ncbi:hypothetical protein E4U54_006885 [Claviceps lovelessii]|nr:hypothetical protein E4U54_006885 [Claviceps lovelessii]
MKFTIVLSLVATALAKRFNNCECKVDGKHSGPLTEDCVANDDNGKLNQDDFGAQCKNLWAKDFGGFSGKTGEHVYPGSTSVPDAPLQLDIAIEVLFRRGETGK